MDSLGHTSESLGHPTERDGTSPEAAVGSLERMLDDFGAQALAIADERNRLKRINALLGDALAECADYLDCIPESAAGGDDDAQRLVRQALTAIRASEAA